LHALLLLLTLLPFYGEYNIFSDSTNSKQVEFVREDVVGMS